MKKRILSLLLCIVMVLSLTGILGKGLGFVTGAAMDGMDALLTRIFFGA